MKPIHASAGDDKLGGTEENGGMDMTEPQVWTLIGVFVAIMLGGMTLMTTLLTRVVRSEIGRLEVKFDALDREVSNLARRLWHDSE